MKISLVLWLSFFFYYYWICFSFNVSLVSGHSVHCLEDRKFLLLELKKNLEFNPTYSNKLVLWNESIPCSEWSGVTWDDEGHVAGLDLSEEFISDGLDNSSTLFSLQHLKHLNLAFNDFTSVIPSRIKDLKSLNSLNLSNAGFVGQILMEIAQLTRLTILDLSQLVESTPKFEDPNLVKLVQNLSEVRELYLDGFNIKLKGNVWVRALSSFLPHLQVLHMSDCNFLSAPPPKLFAKFSNLTQLHLSSCGLSGRFPSEIFQVQSLTSLDLSYNVHLQGSLPDFPQNISLQTLILSKTYFIGLLPASISNLQKLSTLEIFACQFNGTLPDSMSNLPGLTYVDLSSNLFTGPIPQFVMAKKLTYIDLSNNKLSGGISLEHFKGLPNLQNIDLSNNRFQGQLDAISNVSSFMVRFLDLSSNRLEGPIPQFIFHLKGLELLDLSSNKFNGTIRLDMFERLQNLSALVLSNNNLSIDTNVKNANRLFFPYMSSLLLASCNLRQFPNILRNLSKLTILDLSGNEIADKIPDWIWEFSDLTLLNLSHNLLQGRKRIPNNLTFYSNLKMLDLHDNRLQGTLPAFPPLAYHLDFSYNKFSSIIPPDIGNYVTNIVFLLLSHNALYGRIPFSICDGLFVKVLDLSYNNFSGGIPDCLPKRENLGVLNFGKNNLSGNIPDTFQFSCALQSLDLSSNNLQGPIPKSLSHCTTLEVLDIGKNKIHDEFPCLLKKIPTLRVLVLPRNNFHGPIGCPNMKKMIWEKLQIVDLAFNNFNGTLPGELFSTWKAMILDKNQTTSKVDQIQFNVSQFTQAYYQDRVIVTMKGQERTLTKILNVFTSIDLSSNHFKGSIPEEMMYFTALHGLNLSNNNLSGHIPLSIGKLQQLESLDLSNNSLGGEIPQDLASLSFLSFLNLSYNHLEGKIPTGTQLQSFEASSFQGNDGLYGPPLTQSPNNGTPGLMPPPTSANNHESDLEFITGLEIGVVFGLGIIIVPLFFWKRWRIIYWQCVDFILCSIFPQIYVDYQRREVQWIPVLRWSH